MKNKIKNAQKKQNSYRQSSYSFIYFSHHKTAFLSSFQQLSRSTLASLTTIIVIGISLALPLFLYVFLNNITEVGNHLDNSAQISLYLQPEIEPQAIEALQAKIKKESIVDNFEYVSPEQGLEMFEKKTGLNNVVSILEKNPLPPVLVVKLKTDIHNAEKIHALLTEVKQWESVSSAELDMLWVERLYSILDLAEHILYVLAVLFAGAVFLIIGNTMRLIIQSYRDEIGVIKLIGATDRFIRRPFLYSGFLYGLGGGIIAWLLVDTALAYLQEPAQHLASLYNNHYQLHHLDAQATLSILFGSALLGLLSSWFNVSKYIKEVEPQ